MIGYDIHRCSICNRTNNEEVETDPGDFVEFMAFVPDPMDNLFDICMECFENIRDCNSDFPEDLDYESDED